MLARRALPASSPETRPAHARLSRTLPALSFQRVTTVKFCNPCVLITIQNAGGGYTPPILHLKYYFKSLYCFPVSGLPAASTGTVRISAPSASLRYPFPCSSLATRLSFTRSRAEGPLVSFRSTSHAHPAGTRFLRNFQLSTFNCRLSLDTVHCASRIHALQ